MGTLSELQQAAVLNEFHQQEVNKGKAKKVVDQHARDHDWTEDDRLLVSDMLGLDLPPTMLYSGTPNSFNGGIS